ncbi:uncharacterized protein LOC114735218 isoform X2 [Neltuma alba]|uniref:uncharacterized protein LOC114735218 isoform X2 n=1 Tax=Neltuma alba TaxID=207710 RepID=UPI0010A3A55C|nr:uncharacterized protein LOC114735218 isoform X2 [Prosopis alba]
MPKSEIPSWFPNRGSIPSNESGTSEYELVVDVPPYFRASKWSGLAVYLEIKDSSTCDKLVISWSCKAREDYYICKEWENEISLMYAWQPRLCLMLLDFNEKTCWQHLRGNSNCLHIKLSVTCQYSKSPRLKCGWRVLSKEEMQDWGNPTIDFNRLTQAEHNSCPELPPLRLGNFHGRTCGRRNVSSSSNRDSLRRQNQGRRDPLLLAWWPI